MANLIAHAIILPKYSNIICDLIFYVVITSGVIIFLQYAIPLGRMWHSVERGRGVHVRSFQARKTYFHADCDYTAVLEQAKTIIFHGGEGRNK